MMRTGKIQAIKAVRDLSAQAQIVKDETTGRHYVYTGAGLKETKDLVEAIMDMAVREFIESRRPALIDNMRNQIMATLRYDPQNRG